MSRDNCENLTDTPTFELRVKFHEQDVPTSSPASWVEEVTFIVGEYVSRCVFVDVF